MPNHVRDHRYSVTITWQGNRGAGTSTYRAYARDYEITADGKSAIAGSSDPLFRGDHTRWNPEELLVASVSCCHQLWYLHLAADAGIVVTAYADKAEGLMVVLHPVVTIAPGSDVARATALHRTAHEKCFIANSVNFPVTCKPSIIVGA